MSDVTTLDAIIRALYDSISGPAGERDWRRFASLFAPGARLVPVSPDERGVPTPRALDVDAFVEDVAPYFREHSFHETETGRDVERFECVVHAFSSYESRHAPEEEPFARGVNSIQLLDDGTRWWILNVTWPRVVDRG